MPAAPTALCSQSSIDTQKEVYILDYHLRMISVGAVEIRGLEINTIWIDVCARVSIHSIHIIKSRWEHTPLRIE